MANVNYFINELDRAIETTAKDLESRSFVPRLWQRDFAIWRSEELHKKSILNRLGWLESVELMEKNAAQLAAFSEEIRTAGFTHAVVLGMGGSSLCPDVCRHTFGSAKGYPELLVLDSTNPASVARVERSISAATTLFIVASKSGGTTETNMFYRYFYDKVGRIKKEQAGDNFIAITDAGTQMEAEAKDKKFRRIFLNPSDIGGRYSALSYFGLVPMAVSGIDIGRILQSARSVAAASRAPRFKENPAALLGLTLGEAWRAGRDKLTFISSSKIETFAFWVEQLVAESTGKEGKGIIPIEGETALDAYTPDRLFVLLRLEHEGPLFEGTRSRLSSQGHPVVEIVLENEYELGGEFFRWEFATAFAAVLMQINPFDEPNVKESKDNTVRVIEEFKKAGRLPQQKLLAKQGSLEMFAEAAYAERLGGAKSFAQLFATHCAECTAGGYAAILAYLDQNADTTASLQALRRSVGVKTRCVTTLGFGPRYLHSTGQLHKGGPPKGVFLIITADEPIDEKIPGEPYTFEVLEQAQAIGDYLSLSGRALPVIRVHLGADIMAGLKSLHSLME